MQHQRWTYILAQLVTHLQAGEAKEEDSADPDLVHKVQVACLDSLPHIVHDMHPQNLDSPGLDAPRQHVKLHCKEVCVGLQWRDGVRLQSNGWL